MNKASFTVSEDKRTLIMERAFNAPAEKIWQAYADPSLLARWFSPNGWTTEVLSHRFEDGGEFAYLMRCIDEGQEWFGATSSGKMRFSNLLPCTCFEYMDVFTDENGVVNESMPTSHSVVTIIPQSPSSSVLRVETTYANAEALAQVLEMGMQAGYSETLDKMDTVLSISAKASEPS